MTNMHGFSKIDLIKSRQTRDIYILSRILIILPLDQYTQYNNVYVDATS